MIKDALFPNEVIYTTQHFILSQDCEVPIPAFFILSTKRDIKSIADFSDEEVQELLHC